MTRKTITINDKVLPLYWTGAVVGVFITLISLYLTCWGFSGDKSWWAFGALMQTIILLIVTIGFTVASIDEM